VIEHYSTHHISAIAYQHDNTQIHLCIDGQTAIDRQTNYMTSTLVVSFTEHNNNRNARGHSQKLGEQTCPERGLPK